MIELIQFPWSPYCIMQRRILEYSGARFKIVNIPPTDRSLVWRLTKHRYYSVPIVKHGKTIVFETDENSQVVAKYLDLTLQLDIFPREWSGIQNLLWRVIESEAESYAFKLNDIYWEEFVPAGERLDYLRHKERKYGRGCITQWRAGQSGLLEGLVHILTPFDQMLLTRPFLLTTRPLFLDFDLFGVLGNFLYSGHNEIPSACDRLFDWYQRMEKLQIKPEPSS